MNLQRIERLKGLLARVELNAKLPRVLQLVSAPTIAVEPLEPVSLISAPESSAQEVSEAEFLVPSRPIVPSPQAIVPPPPQLEEMELDELGAVELPPVAFESKPAAVESEAVLSLEPAAVESEAVLSLEPAALVSEPVLSLEPAVAEPAVSLEIEDVSAEEISFEEVEEPLPAPSVPLRTDVQAVPMPFTAPPSLDELTFSEPPPPAEASPISARQVVEEPPESLDAALLAAVQAQRELEEAEAPLLTPPPESGKQPARAEPAPYRAPAPTMEQLGEVVELEEAVGPALELAEPTPVETKREPEELEFVPPPSAFGAPREALPTLVETESRPTSELPPASLPTLEEPTFEEEGPTSATAASLSAEIVGRKPVVLTQPVIDVISQANAFAPASFLELLDASLKLGRR